MNKSERSANRLKTSHLALCSVSFIFTLLLIYFWPRYNQNNVVVMHPQSNLVNVQSKIEPSAHGEYTANVQNSASASDIDIVSSFPQNSSVSQFMQKLVSDVLAGRGSSLKGHSRYNLYPLATKCPPDRPLKR